MMKISEFFAIVRAGIMERVKPSPMYRLRFNEAVPTISGDQNLMLLKLDIWDPEYRSWQTTQVALDTKRRRVAYGGWTNASLFDKQHKGSGWIGVMLVSFPFLLVLSPVLAPLSWWYRRKERVWGMSVHAHSFQRALAGQLPTHVATLLDECLKNDWVYDCRMRQRVSFEEAKAMLKKLDMVQEVILREDSDDGAEYRNSFWYDSDRELVAQGRLHGRSDIVQVLGSSFVDMQARELRDCFASADRHMHRRKPIS